jgi:hypothetical protein
MPSIFSRFLRVGRLPEPLRVKLAPEGILHVAERVHVTQRFSGSAPGVHSAMSVNRQLGLVVFTRERLYALLPTVPRLKAPRSTAGGTTRPTVRRRSPFPTRACGSTSTSIASIPGFAATCR